MYRVIVKYPVCAYVVTYYNVQSIKTPLHSEFWCGAASHYYTTRQSPSHYLTSGQIIRWLVMIGHQMLILSACLLSDLMEFLDLFLKRPLPKICTFIVLFLEIYVITIPEFFHLLFSPPKHILYQQNSWNIFSIIPVNYMDFKKAFVEWSNYSRINSNFYIHIMSPERSSSL